MHAATRSGAGSGHGRVTRHSRALLLDAQSRPTTDELAFGEELERDVLGQHRHRQAEILDGARPPGVVIVVGRVAVAHALGVLGLAGGQPAAPRPRERLEVVRIVHGRRQPRP